MASSCNVHTITPDYSAVEYVKGLFPPLFHNSVAIVGGTVRDMLFGRASQDIDLVAALPHEQLMALGFRLVAASSGADIYFRHHSDYGKVEVTRIDGMASLAADLRRRDFTVNAMAMGLDGALVDPLGGRNDLKGNLIRACRSDSFLNDPLRIFRGFRFETHGWQMVPDTEALISASNCPAAFSCMPVERFSNEMTKALAGRFPERFFQRMIEFNVGVEFLPVLFRMPEIPAGPLEHHPEGDLFTHSIQVLQRVAEKTADPQARFCAMFHDIGKLATAPALYPKHHGHDEAGFNTAAAFCNRLCLPAAYRKGLSWISRLHTKANKWDGLRDSTKIRMAEQAIKAGVVYVLPMVSAADKPDSRTMAGWDEAVCAARMPVRDLGIDQRKLEEMPIGDRPSYIMQKRVETLRASR